MIEEALQLRHDLHEAEQSQAFDDAAAVEAAKEAARRAAGGVG